jgi:hypothetical protein
MPRIETKVCPIRLMEMVPDEVMEALDWFLWSVELNPMTGRPTGIREWPCRGGVLRQPAKLVEVAELLKNEFPYLPQFAAKPQQPKGRGRR